MDTLLASPDLILFARLALGGVFVFSALAKILDRGADAAFADRAWLPPALARLAGRVLPWIEGIVGALLVLGLATQWAALGAVVLLLIFTAVVIADLRQGRMMPCNCFGRFSRENASPVTVGRNVVLLILAGLVAWHPVPYLALDSLIAGPAASPAVSLVDAIPVFFLAFAVVVVVVLGETLLATIRSFLRAF